MLLFLYARRHYYNRMPKLQIAPEAEMRAEAHPSRRWDLKPQDSAALWAVAALLYGPCSVFLYANYTESLFVLLLVGFLYCLQGRLWCCRPHRRDRRSDSFAGCPFRSHPGRWFFLMQRCREIPRRN